MSRENQPKAVANAGANRTKRWKDPKSSLRSLNAYLTNPRACHTPELPALRDTKSSFSSWFESGCFAICIRWHLDTLNLAKKGCLDFPLPGFSATSPTPSTPTLGSTQLGEILFHPFVWNTFQPPLIWKLLLIPQNPVQRSLHL